MNKSLALLGILAVLTWVALATNPHVPSAPIVVAAPDFLNQTADLPRTTVFTPTVSGMYRITVYQEFVPQPPSSPCSSMEVLWTDDQNILHSHPLLNCIDFGGGEAIIYAIAGTSVDVDTHSSSLSGQPYNLFVVVEQL